MRLLSCLLTLACVLVVLPSAAHAATPLYFTDAGGPNTWDNATTHDWATSSGGSYTSLWSGGDAAYFEGTPGTVNVSGTISSVSSINFSTDGYTITGGKLTPTSSAGWNITTGAGSDTIASFVGGTYGIDKYGDGTLILANSANNYNEGIALFAGTVNVGAAQNGTIGPLGNMPLYAGIYFLGGTLQYSSANHFDYSQYIMLANSTGYKVDTNGQNVTWAGTLTGYESYLSKNGSGTLTLASSTSNYTWGTAIYGGTVTVGAAKMWVRTPVRWAA